MSNWMARYQAGQRVQVWTQIVGMGAAVRSGADRDEAASVALEIMRRARENVERLIDVLPQHGYEFDDPVQALVPPPPNVVAQVDALEERVGVLPLSLRYWIQEVGQVNLNGHHPEWRYSYPDPLGVITRDVLYT